MPTLIIRHLETPDSPRFQVVRPEPFKTTEPVTVADPTGLRVEGRPDSPLSAELRWYLEEFLDYPFPPVTERAEQVQAALRGWGAQAFEALFGSGLGRDFYSDAARQGLEKLHIQVASDHPGVLAWPWEALFDPQVGTLAHVCRIERQIHQLRDPLPLGQGLPQERINILLITARPFAGDVRYRSVSRPLVELIEKQNLPAQVTVLRPPSFDRLREHLRERPHFYHIVHFDGHGGYGLGEAAPDESGPGHLFQGPQGRLIFENAQGKPDAITAEQLGALLREYRLPVMVLNACQSAMVDSRAETAFASVAASLLRAGVRSVVAMAYSLYVSGAEVFLPDFYRRLFESGSVAEAARVGRQAMLREPRRVCARGRFPLEDWLVPVVYQQEPPDLSFAGRGERAVTPKVELPEEAQDSENPYGFIGRDGALLELERALRRPPAGILIHGLGGSGKTTLARGLVQWLAVTGGLGQGCFWFTFNDIRSSEYVFNRLVEGLFGTQALAADLMQKQAALMEVFRKERFLLVWDIFESASGIPGTDIEARLPQQDRERLREFLHKLRGGQTKVIITSRSRESWLNGLSAADCFALPPLSGLHGEERWAYCAVILQDLGMQADQNDPALVELMDLLDGNPLAMRALLPRLGEVNAATLAARLRGRLGALEKGDDPAQARLFATLSFVEDALPLELKPLLTPLALHERFVNARYLEIMAQQANAPFGRADIERCLEMLTVAGLLHGWGQGVYAMHPALTGFLRARLGEGAQEDADAWRRVFVEVMGSLADALTPKQLHEQRVPFHLHGANFHTALAEAEKLGMVDHFAALTQALGAYAQNCWDLESASRRFAVLAEHASRCNRPELEAEAYHQLGRIAEERRDFTAAEQWYRKSLAIEEKHGNEHGAASTYHQLGRIAQERRDFTAAEQWYRKALAIWEKHGNEHGAASTYGQLGILAGLQGHFVESGRWLVRCITAFDHQHDPHNVEQGRNNFLIIYRQAPPDDQATLRKIWEEANLGPFPEQDGNPP